MRKLVLVTLAVVVLGSIGFAQDAAKPQIKVSADLELFYELSDDVGGSNDGDKFKSNQLYLKFDGKFEAGMAARVVLDAADIVSSDGKVVTEKVVEEANFTFSDIGGSPVTLVFGKDEMPFGLDYDKHIKEGIPHLFELDKVWGLHAILDLEKVGSLAAAVYQHNHTLGAGEVLIDADNEVGDNYTVKLTVDKLVKGVTLVLSGGEEAYGNISTTDESGVSAVELQNDETRLGAGLVFVCPVNDSVLNVEYVSFSNRGGSPDYDPSVVTIGVEFPVTETTTLWGRYEIIDEDSSSEVETDLWTVGLAYSPVANYTISIEYANMNSSDYKGAADLMIPEGSIEDSLILGVRAKF